MVGGGGAALCLPNVDFFTRLDALQTHFCSLRKLIQGAIYSFTIFPTIFPFGPIFPDYLTIFIGRGGGALCLPKAIFWADIPWKLAHIHWEWGGGLLCVIQLFFLPKLETHFLGRQSLYKEPYIPWPFSFLVRYSLTICPYSWEGGGRESLYREPYIPLPFSLLGRYSLKTCPYSLGVGRGAALCHSIVFFT